MSSVGNVSNTPYTNPYAAKSGQNTAAGKKAEEQKTGDTATIQKMWDDINSATQSLRSMVFNLLGTGKTSAGEGQGFWAVRANPEQYGVKVDEQTRAEAEAMIADDGYYGVEQTKSRIMDFAKALAGGNATAETIENLRDGAQKGFDEAAKAFGGFDKMPEVTKKTYEAVMKAFDDWKAEISQ